MVTVLWNNHSMLSMNMAYINLFYFCLTISFRWYFLKFILDCYHLDVLCIDLTCDNHFCSNYLKVFVLYITSEKKITFMRCRCRCTLPFEIYDVMVEYRKRFQRFHDDDFFWHLPLLLRPILLIEFLFF